MRVKTGSKRVVVNVWSDAARKAAAEARKLHAQGGKAWRPHTTFGERYKGIGDGGRYPAPVAGLTHPHSDSANRATSRARAKAIKSPDMAEIREAHTQAAEAHGLALKAYKPGTSQYNYHSNMQARHRNMVDF